MQNDTQYEVVDGAVQAAFISENASCFWPAITHSVDFPKMFDITAAGDDDFGENRHSSLSSVLITLAHCLIQSTPAGTARWSDQLVEQIVH